jgi:hypothetical protein
VLRGFGPFAFGVEASAALNLFECDGETSCDAYQFMRIGGLAEAQLKLGGDDLQSVAVVGAVAPALVRTSEPTQPGPRIAARPAATAWGAGMSVSAGPRLKMRWLTIEPYAEISAFTVGAHVAVGLGLRMGCRF